MKRLFLTLALLLIPLTGKAADFPGGGGNGAAGPATGIDIDGDGTLEVTGVADTSIDLDPDDDTNVNLRIIDNSGGWIAQRLDTTFKNVWSVADDTGNIIVGDGTEGTWRWDGATGDVEMSAAGGIVVTGSVPIITFGGFSLRAFSFGSDGTIDTIGDLALLSGTGAGDVLFLESRGTTTPGEIKSSVADGATQVGWIVNNTTALTTDGAKLMVFHNNEVLQAGIYADGEIQVGAIEADAPTANVACDNDAVGTRVYVDDTNDSAPGRNCYCTDVDDGSTFDYRDANGVTNAVCDQI